MKNYLLLIVDSLNYSHVKESKIELMPFLRSIEQEGVFCENMYSQAPYTEAAVMNIYCGQDVLNHGGYLKRLKDSPCTIFEVMQGRGYQTYFNSFQPQCFPSSLRRGVDDIYYSVGYDLGALWSYRLSHYAALQQKGDLTQEDMQNLIEILDDNFKEWLIFIDNVINRDSSCAMIVDNAKDYGAKAVRESVQKEYKAFLEDREGYVSKLLTEGKKHSIYSIPAYDQDGKIKQRDIMPKVRKLMLPLFKRIRKTHRRLNLKNNKGIFRGTFQCFGRFIKKPSKISFKNFLKSGYAALDSIKDIDLFQRIDEKNYDSFKNAPSARTHFQHYLDWAEAHKEKPYFACIHIDDIHNPENFFTYDSADLGLLKQEKEEAEKVLNLLGKDYYGNITHDLSLRYMDNAIKHLFEEMKTKGLLEDTCIMITADHGFSFAGNPLRESFVVNYYLENYNVPFVVYNSGRKPQRIENLFSTKDIPATLLDLAFDVKEKGFSGKSVFATENDVYLRIEYCGGGCPDLSRRELRVAAFDKGYFVGAICALNEEFNESKITELYNLSEDRKQLKNIAKKGVPQEATHLYEAIERRLKELQEQEFGCS